MKKPINVLSIAIIVLLAVQIVLMFMPYFTFTPKPSKKVPDPQPQNYSLQDYCWMDTEEMEQYFEDLIEDYYVNDHAVSLVLTFVFAAVGIILNALNFKNSFNKYITFRAGMINVFTHVGSIFWVYIALTAYFTSGVLQFGNQALYTASLVVIFVTAVLVLARLVLQLVFDKKKSAPSTATTA